MGAGKPSEYVGIDITPGPGVDRVLDIMDAVNVFGPCSFDLVISTEVLEHVKEWKLVILEMKRLLKPGGTIVLTTRSPGFKLHGYPEDHWRFPKSMVLAMFRDMEILRFESDAEKPGILVFASKPKVRYVEDPLLDVDAVPVDRSRTVSVHPVPDITVITPTRDRPEAFRLCEKWMSRQRLIMDVQWIVVDDGDTPVRCRTGQEYLRLLPTSRINTLTSNLEKALKQARGRKLIIVEDDDWYPTNYLDEISQRLDSHDMCGEIRARYYNVREARWGVGTNTAHASLCRTGIRAGMIEDLKSAVEETARAGDVFVDLRLWGAMAGWETRPSRKALFDEPKMCVSMKAMPGRGGLGKSHRPSGLLNEDRDGAVLRSWVGKDADMYLAFRGGK